MSAFGRIADIDGMRAFPPKADIVSDSALPRYTQLFAVSVVEPGPGLKTAKILRVELRSADVDEFWPPPPHP